jgi:putative nucleotidyltransferase with HDIG domain
MAHSEYTATLCDIFCDHFTVKDAEAAYTAGLMHDIGKLVIAMANRDALGEVLDFSRLTGAPMIEVERELLGINHAEISGMVAERWHLPDAIGDAVHRHHNPEPDTPSAAPLSLVVANANDVINSIGLAVVPEKPTDFILTWPGREFQTRAALDSFRIACSQTENASSQENTAVMGRAS